METIYLTRRNLQTLLNKLDRKGSACSLIKADTVHPRYPIKRPTMIKALEDDEYYTDREPGAVLPEDEP
jgi:hypothetical protein